MAKKKWTQEDSKQAIRSIEFVEPDFTIKDSQPEQVKYKYLNQNQLDELRYHFFLENAFKSYKIQIETIVFGTDGSVMIVYVKDGKQERKFLNK